MTVPTAPNAAFPEPDARMPRFVHAGDAPDTTRLRRLRVALIGAGAVGRPMAVHLARLGVHTLWIVDGARFKPESLLTQPILPSDVDRPKATNLAECCRAISPATRVFALDDDFESLQPAALVDADLVLLATDNLRAELLVGQCCHRLGKPLFQASVHGDTLTCQVRSFSNASADTPCPACGFGAEEWAHLHRSTTFSCAGGLASADSRGQVTAPPTRSVSFLCALAGDLALMQVLRHVLDLGQPVLDRVLDYTGYTHRTALSPLPRRTDCPADHTPWSIHRVSGSLRDRTLRQLAALAGIEGDDRLAAAQFTPGGLAFVQQAACDRGHLHALATFAEDGAAIGDCRCCRRPLRPSPHHTHRPAAGRRLGELLDRPLFEIADPLPDAVVIGEGDRSFLLATTAEREETDR